MAASNPEVYYKLLGLAQGTSSEDAIKRAYRAAALRWHPDKNPNDKVKSEEMFKKVSEAYSVLTFLSKSQKRDGTPAVSSTRASNGGSGSSGVTASRGPANARPAFDLDDAFNIFEELFGGEDLFSALDSDPFFSVDSKLAGKEHVVSAKLNVPAAKATAASSKGHAAKIAKSATLVRHQHKKVKSVASVIKRPAKK